AQSMTANVSTTLTGAAGSAVPTASLPAVIVKDGAGNPVPGASVTFSPNGGTITIGANSAPPGTLTTTTNASGIAALTAWTLPTPVGTASVTATLNGVGVSPVTFSATVTASTASQLAVVTAPNSPTQSGATFTTQPAIQRRDQFGNPVLAAA